MSTYKKVKLLENTASSKANAAASIEGTLNLDPDSKNVLFIVNESVKKTIPYRNISSIDFYMANDTLRILYRDGSNAEAYLDMDLPKHLEPELLKQLQAQTGIAIHLS
ncbi:hypothetical protein [Paracidobacterium acidisoli]|uniref:hypothetical protein n=1 Tax=Paracidobacterium acidisoli TaxID=2303751 RepID=UPI0011C1C843|nr:hypothetical protein [Paracidobacterium acidisoli]MBT9331782.1 hypothetical protein [Paracidobacterium acidisoli]